MIFIEPQRSGNTHYYYVIFLKIASLKILFLHGLGTVFTIYLLILCKKEYTLIIITCYNICDDDCVIYGEKCTFIQGND